MMVFHGHPSPNALAECRAAAPSHEHGAEWSPAKMTPHDEPFILDNGAFRAWKRNELWDVDGFVERLGQLREMPRPPDFVILPDVVTDSEATEKRTAKWADHLRRWPAAYPVQNGVKPEEAVALADERDCQTLFIGGTMAFKQTYAEAFIIAAHNHGLQCHIGRPGDLQWARDIGADSVDTTSIVQDQNWERLRRLEAGQQRLSEVNA